MRTVLKTYIVSTLLILAFSISVDAQTKKVFKGKTTGKNTTITKKTTVTNKKAIPGKRVSSSKVVYKKPTKKVVSVRNVPNKTVVKHNGQNYYYKNNKFYTQSRGRYIVIAPKVGFRIQVLPPTHVTVVFNHRNYYNVQGIFYMKVNNEYEVVEPEIGTVVYELPADYEKVTYDGLSYYEYANVLYEKVQVNGSRAYEVVGIVDME